MAKLFRKRRKDHPKKVDTRDLVDPISYMGGLDGDKYPILPLENENKSAKPEEEIENPLNKR